MPQISICRSPKTEPPEPLETRTLVVRRIFDEGHHITLDVKCAGARSAGNPHATCDEAGAGNRLTVRLVRHSQRNGEKWIGRTYGATAQLLHPTGVTPTHPLPPSSARTTPGRNDRPGPPPLPD